ncbi:hypothetical protein HN873_004556 [Arachis hypogaea]
MQRRRDRINERMRALQELIPRCNKSNKASMLDEPIEYMKSLKLQVQVYSFLLSSDQFTCADDVHGMQHATDDVLRNPAVYMCVVNNS